MKDPLSTKKPSIGWREKIHYASSLIYRAQRLLLIARKRHEQKASAT